MGSCEAVLGVAGGLLEAWLLGEVGVTLLSCVTGDDGAGAFTELALGDVNLRGRVLGCGRPGDGVEFSVVGGVLDVDVAAYVAVVGLLITVDGEGEMSAGARREEMGKRWQGKSGDKYVSLGQQ